MYLCLYIHTCIYITHIGTYLYVIKIHGATKEANRGGNDIWRAERTNLDVGEPP